MRFETNTILQTKDGRKIGNAIIRGFDKLSGVYLITTDYGNNAILSANEINELFYLHVRSKEENSQREPHKNVNAIGFDFIYEGITFRS